MFKRLRTHRARLISNSHQWPHFNSKKHLLIESLIKNNSAIHSSQYETSSSAPEKKHARTTIISNTRPTIYLINAYVVFEESECSESETLGSTACPFCVMIVLNSATASGNCDGQHISEPNYPYWQLLLTTRCKICLSSTRHWISTVCS
jgi:hypothetical protein